MKEKEEQEEYFNMDERRKFLERLIFRKRGAGGDDDISDALYTIAGS